MNDFVRLAAAVPVSWTQEKEESARTPSVLGGVDGLKRRVKEHTLSQWPASPSHFRCRRTQSPGYLGGWGDRALLVHMVPNGWKDGVAPVYRVPGGLKGLSPACPQRTWWSKCLSHSYRCPGYLGGGKDRVPSVHRVHRGQKDWVPSVYRVSVELKGLSAEDRTWTGTCDY